MLPHRKRGNSAVMMISSASSALHCFTRNPLSSIYVLCSMPDRAAMCPNPVGCRCVGGGGKNQHTICVKMWIGGGDGNDVPPGLPPWCGGVYVCEKSSFRTGTGRGRRPSPRTLVPTHSATCTDIYCMMCCADTIHPDPPIVYRI